MSKTDRLILSVCHQNNGDCVHGEAWCYQHCPLSPLNEDVYDPDEETWQPCPHCNGTGQDRYDLLECDYCNGEGYVWE